MYIKRLLTGCHLSIRKKKECVSGKMEKGKQLAFRKKRQLSVCECLASGMGCRGEGEHNRRSETASFLFFFSEALVRFTSLLLPLQVQALFVFLLLFSLFATTLLSVFRKFMKSLQPFFFLFHNIRAVVRLQANGSFFFFFCL